MSQAGPTITREVPLPDGRVLALDDVGDPGGVPVLYLHGTPDSRLARHPDDGLAGRAGVRLLAVDRPGYGGSDPWPPGVPATALAADMPPLLDGLGVGRVAVLAWSGGALPALAVAATLGDRVTAVGIASGVVPCEAQDDPDVRAAAPERGELLAMADELPPGELGEIVAPLLAPYPCDEALAAEHRREARDAAGAAALASVPDAEERMARALVEAVRRGLHGVASDVEAANRPFPAPLAALTCPVALWWAADDTLTPPAFGAWYARHLPHATLDVADRGGHYVLLTRWTELLGELAAAAGR